MFCDLTTVNLLLLTPVYWRYHDFLKHVLQHMFRHVRCVFFYVCKLVLTAGKGVSSCPHVPPCVIRANSATSWVTVWSSPGPNSPHGHRTSAACISRVFPTRAIRGVRVGGGSAHASAEGTVSVWHPPPSWEGTAKEETKRTHTVTGKAPAHNGVHPTVSTHMSPKGSPVASPTGRRGRVFHR